MIIEQALMTKLNAIAALTALVSTRIYFVKAGHQDEETPYLIIQKISAPRGHTHDGPDGSVQSRFQFSAFATTYKGCKDILEAVRGGIDGSSGLWSTVQIGFCDYDNETDLWDEETGLFGLAADYLIMYLEV